MLFFKIILFHSVVFAYIKINRIELFYKKCWGIKKILIMPLIIVYLLFVKMKTKRFYLF